MHFFLKKRPMSRWRVRIYCSRLLINNSNISLPFSPETFIVTFAGALHWLQMHWIIPKFSAIFFLKVCFEDWIHPGQIQSVSAASCLSECKMWSYVWPSTGKPSVLTLPVIGWQIFWMLGSMLIIILGMTVVPTMGWRWMIRFSIIPSIILIGLFMVSFV